HGLQDEEIECALRKIERFVSHSASPLSLRQETTRTLVEAQGKQNNAPVFRRGDEHRSELTAFWTGCVAGNVGRGLARQWVMAIETSDRNRRRLAVEILSPAVIEEMVGKIREASSAPGARDDVSRWRAAHGNELWHKRGHDFAVVGQTLMYLHDGPDGMLVPHSRYPDGTEKVYTDSAHAREVYTPDHLV